MGQLILIFAVMATFSFSINAKSILYVQSPKAKLLSEPQLSSEGSALTLGESLNPVSEQGLFVQVRIREKTGWVSKLFVSPLPPSSQIKLGTSSNSTETVAARQRASDFTKTAAARGLSETEKMRVRGGAELYDFESLRWLESLSESSAQNGEATTTGNQSTTLENDKGFDLPSPSDTTKAEVKMGRALSARLLKKYPLYKIESLTRYINQVGGRIAAVSSRRDLSFKFGVLDTLEENAFACPGGFIFITKGTLKRVKSETELAGILSHEVGHVVLFHSGQFTSPNIFLEILTGLLSPSGGEVIGAAASAALDGLESQLLEKGRDAAVEWEADEAGVALASQAGYAPSGLGDFLSSLAKSENAKTFKKTHPDTNERIARLVKIEANQEKIESNPPKDQWNRFKDLLQR